ncbi:F-box DNA helicase 1 isoform X5 [Coturnix japonica]|uniref:F-box DNA helicase 1 isoform X5 n=1 Tax=Coturnix japonica TaxID=93934 RepID=UPI0013A5D814|nr:F-box DNA helicase 1 isoform X5 [Coturnix japonica]
MKRFKKMHLTADDCEALRRSTEGLSSLTQPLKQRRSRGDVNRGLQPTHRTRRQPRAQGQQKNITDYFKISQTQQTVAGRTSKNISVKEELLDPFFAEDDESSISNVLETSDDSSSFLEDEYMGNSRKRPLSSTAPGRLQIENDLWGEPEKKAVVVHPEDTQIKQELDDEIEIEPVPDAHYGLLGTRNWEVPQGSIEDLPDEVLRIIFAFLPVTDLFQSLSLVCHRWRIIVGDPRFIPWKKLYHQYLLKEDMALHRVERVLQDFAITDQSKECILGLIRCVSAISTSRHVDPSAVLQCLKCHHLFSRAEVCIANKLPHLQSKTGPENMWAIITAMVLFSDGVRDIQRLMACLQRPCSSLSIVDVTETLYCIATLLYAMREKNIAITNRIHYNIFYCLYLMENASVTAPQVVEEGTPSSRCRQDFWSSSLSEVKLTHEQQRILNHKIERGQIVKIMAFAGTGKTSTLVKYAEKFADLSFLYVTFNKAVAERGRLVFPRNVTCKTFHSLAFGSIGKQYKEKGKLNFSKLSAYSVSFLIQNREGQSIFIRGKTVSQTLENFFASSDEEICEEHSPVWFKNTHGERKLVSPKEKRINVEEAKEIWRNMKNLDGDVERKYKITCDGYLKLWQLSKPQLSGYDAIFVDEAQDCTPAIVDIVLSQTCGVILVGDPHQQIYSFRGAVNSLYAVPHTHIYYLTQSFRFGPEIAYIGATILDICKGIRNKTLVGGNQEGDVRGSMAGKITMLSRSNFTVFEDAAKLVGRERQIKIHIIGGLVRFGLSKIYDIWKLSLPADERAKDYLIGTVHQAKGLEFDTVLVADDFVDVPCVSGNNQRRPQFIIGMYPEDEWNLLYVAVTRAKKCLLMSQSLEHLLALAGEHFLRVELLGEAVKTSIACSEQRCQQTLPSDIRLVVKKLPLIHSNGSKDTGGYLCYSCVQKRFGTMTPLAFLPTLH